MGVLATSHKQWGFNEVLKNPPAQVLSLFVITNVSRVPATIMLLVFSDCLSDRGS